MSCKSYAILSALISRLGGYILPTRIRITIIILVEYCIFINTWSWVGLIEKCSSDVLYSHQIY